MRHGFVTVCAVFSGTLFDNSTDSYEAIADVADGLTIRDARAHWIWTDNIGTQQSFDGTDTRIYCRAVIPESCVQSAGCDGGGGVLVNDVHCLRSVRDVC